MTFRFKIKFKSFNRHQGAYEKEVFIRGHNTEEAVSKFYQKFGNIKIISLDGVPFDALQEEK